jgi:hypothetical protein
MTESTYIPTGHYLSKSQAANILGIPTSTLQYHIGKEHIDTIHFPNLGHLIREKDVNSFKRELEGIKPGRPSIYKKYCERCDKLGFGKCQCAEERQCIYKKVK